MRGLAPRRAVVRSVGLASIPVKRRDARRGPPRPPSTFAGGARGAPGRRGHTRGGPSLIPAEPEEHQRQGQAGTAEGREGDQHQHDQADQRGEGRLVPAPVIAVPAPGPFAALLPPGLPPPASPGGAVLDSPPRLADGGGPREFLGAVVVHSAHSVPLDLHIPVVMPAGRRGRAPPRRGAATHGARGRMARAPDTQVSGPGDSPGPR